MQIAEAIFGRRSVREYLPESIDEATIRSLIEAAIQAPSAVNQQPWTFTVVGDEGVLNRLSDEAKLHMLATMPQGSTSDHLRPMLSDPGFHIFYHAPLLVLISAVASGPWIVEDCALAAENLMLAAHGAGLGTCWIGFAQGFLNTMEGKKLLGLPVACVPVAPIIVGRPKSPPHAVFRKKAEVRWIG